MFNPENVEYLAKFCGECVPDSEVWHALAGRLKNSETDFNYDRFIDRCYQFAGIKLAKELDL